MAEIERRLKIKFDGLDAAKHELDMRQFGESLVGLERLAQVGIVTLIEGRLPTKKEKYPLSLKVRTPTPGSVELVLFIEWAGYALPIVKEVVKDSAKDILKSWFGWVFNKMGGREKEAEPHFVELMRLTTKMHDDALHDRRATERFMLDVLDRVAPLAKKAVSPIGQSCDSLQIGEDAGPALISVDAPMADAIRIDDANTEVGDMETMRVKVDGFTRHNRQMKIAHPDVVGKFITAEILDPAFSTSPNVYTEAANVDGWLEVHAKRTLKDGKLVRLHILNAKAA